MFDKIQEFDFTVLWWIQAHLRTSFGDAVMPFITHLGSAGIFWIAFAFLLLLFPKYRKAGFDMLLGMLIGLIVGNLILKNLVARGRPCWINTDLPAMLIAIPEDYSFPSGHTLSSTIAALVLLRRDKRPGIPAAVLAALIAFSRMYLFVHFPTDILGGFLLGLPIGAYTPGMTQRVLSRLHPAPAVTEDSEGSESTKQDKVKQN